MAVKTLNARGCFADMIDRMWVYLEDGDTENADCVRQKALMLMGLIKTADRWKPSLGKDSLMVTIVSEITSGSFVIPYMYTRLLVNGLPVREARGIVFSGGNSDVFSKINDISDGFPLNDDLFQVSSSAVGSEFTFVAKYTSANSPLSHVKVDETSSVTSTVTTSDPITFDDNPICLTDEQILSVVGKIDELCDCSC
jgi:hypothetical protein